MKHVLVQISPEGEVKIDAIGYQGKTCEKPIALITEALGKAVKTTNKPELYARESQPVYQ